MSLRASWSSHTHTCTHTRAHLICNIFDTPGCLKDKVSGIAAMSQKDIKNVGVNGLFGKNCDLHHSSLTLRFFNEGIGSLGKCHDQYCLGHTLQRRCRCCLIYLGAFAGCPGMSVSPSQAQPHFFLWMALSPKYSHLRASICGAS